MLVLIAAYLIALIAFACFDIAWLTYAGAQLYKPALADILAPGIRFGPAAAFYLLFPIGLIYFAVNPALKDGAVATAIVNGMLFGLFTYGTYELTNFATLRGWTLSITAIDMIYGALVSAAVAAIAFIAAPVVARWVAA